MTASTYQVNSEQAEAFPLLRRAVELLASSPLKTTVDAGCSSGRDTIYLAAEGFRVQAFDRDPTAIQRHALLARKVHH